MIPVTLAPEVADDLKELPSGRLRLVAFQWMSRLRRDPKLGQLLEWRQGTDLRGCRKLYFDEDDEPLKLDLDSPAKRVGGARYRIVYQLLPNDESPSRAYIRAIGAKKDGIYSDAAERPPYESE